MTDLLGVLANIALIAVFLVAGIAKLNRANDLGVTLTGMGLPQPLVRPVSALLPWVEILIALALIPAATVLVGSIAAAAVLVVFTVAIVISLKRERTVTCNCFGQLGSSELGWTHVAQNCTLVACALLTYFLVRQGWPGVVPTLRNGWGNGDGGDFAVVALAVAFFGNAWLTTHLLKQNGRLLLAVDGLKLRLDANGIGEARTESNRIYGLPVGAFAPSFTLPRLGGGLVSLEQLRADGHPILLIFTDPGCGPCTALLPRISRWEASLAGKMSFVLVSRGTEAENRLKLGKLPISTTLLQEAHEVAEQYEALATPSAAVIGPNGLILEPLAMGADQIEAVVRAAGAPVTFPSDLDAHVVSRA